MNKQYKYKGQEKKQKNKIFQDSCFFFGGGGGGGQLCATAIREVKTRE